jgi:hypothetical protein
MEGTVKFVGILMSAMLLTAVVNTVMMETHLMPKQAATRVGVTETEAANQSSPLKPDRQDVQYGDFWMVDQVPC